MSDDLVRKLREQAEELYYAGYGGYDVTMRAAADEIERLGTLLQEARDVLRFARRALAEDSFVPMSSCGFDLYEVSQLRQRVSEYFAAHKEAEK